MMASLVFLASCTPPPKPSDTTQIKQRDTLVIGTLYSPELSSDSQHSSYGMEFELAQSFAQHLGVNLKIVANADLNTLFEKLDNNKIDILATGLTVTEPRLAKMRFGPPYYQVSQQLIFKQGKKRPRKLSDLTGKLMVIDGSSHHETLIELKQDNPELTWQTTTDLNPDQLLKHLIDEKIDYAIVDSTVLARNRRLYPDLSLAMTLKHSKPIAWALSKNTDDSLFSEVISFFGQHQGDGEIIQLEEKYFGHVKRFDYVDTRAFIKAVETKLNKYQILFEIYAEQLRWEQVAAISYQESHWNPRAKSPTGVRGMMMLTLPTAKQMGVKSRLDAEQSIRGGAQYIQSLLKRVPESVPQDQRFWFALAAYNVGFGHLLDARALAKKMNKDPDSWTSIKQILPLLEKAKYYKKTRHGFARGREAVHYVDSIRRYFETLTAMNISSKLEEPSLAIAAKADSLPQQPIVRQWATPKVVEEKKPILELLRIN
ncbi:membrane-bound lytic murein transglycosylase MltF [Alteromonadales bacterium alter-6D02]|nr:membrane-bound lytic murein transglycosylase MltF [Alteromonadales bacterium alter-6D02]